MHANYRNLILISTTDLVRKFGGYEKPIILNNNFSLKWMTEVDFLIITSH